MLKEGDFRRTAQRLATEQEYAGEAHVNSYDLTDLHPVLSHYGNRGYRLAYCNARSRRAACNLPRMRSISVLVGSTALDDEVIEFFSPQAAGKSYMFVAVFGKRRPSGS